MKTIPLFSVIVLGAVIGSAGVGPVAIASEDRQNPRVIQSELPAFPSGVLLQGITRGRARVVINVDEAGAVTEWLAIGYSQEEFAQAAIAAVRRWRFEPLRVHNAPVPSQVALRFDFEATGVVVSMDATAAFTQRAFGAWERDAYSTCTLKDLDQIPMPIVAEAPAYPRELQERGIVGSAVVEFFIDERGQVRMPSVMSADFDELGALAMQAVGSWRFEPPTCRHRPVLVHVRQRFNFADARG